MIDASPDLSVNVPGPTARPDRNVIASRPAALESSWSPTEDGSASAPNGSAPVALTVT